MLLVRSSAASVIVGCQPVASPSIAASPSGPTARPTLRPSPSSTVAPTVAPTTSVSPAPNAARLILSGAALVADARSHLLFQAAGENRLRAVVGSDASTGVLSGDAPARATVWQAPDGRGDLFKGKSTDARRPAPVRLPWLNLP